MRRPNHAPRRRRRPPAPGGKGTKGGAPRQSTWRFVESTTPCDRRDWSEPDESSVEDKRAGFLGWKLFECCAIIAAMLILLYIATVGYLLAGGLAVYRLFHGQTHRGYVVMATLSLAVILHAISRSTTIADAGLDLSFFSALELFSWTAAITLIISTIWVRVENHAAVIAPLIAISIILHQLFPSNEILRLTGDWQLNVHIALATIAWSVFCLAAVHALLLAAQERMLRSHQTATLVRALPPLTVMNELLTYSVRIGFALLTLVLITGSLFVGDLKQQHLIHKTVLSGMAWLLFGSLIWGQWRYGWRGRKAAHWTLWGVGLLVLAYFGSKFVIELLLHRP